MNKKATKVENVIVRCEVKAADLAVRSMAQTAKTIAEIMRTKWGKRALAVPMALSGMSITAYADGEGADAQGMMDAIMGVLGPGVIALGTLVVVVGGIQLGKGFTRDDADGKSTGMMTMIGGAIIAAVGAIVPKSISLGGNG